MLNTDTDADGDGHFVAEVDGTDFIEQREAADFQLFQILALENDQIFIFFEFLDDRIDSAHGLCDLTFNQCREKGTPHLIDRFHRLIVIIDVDQTDDHALGFVLMDEGHDLRLIIEVHRDEL